MRAILGDPKANSDVVLSLCGKNSRRRRKMKINKKIRYQEKKAGTVGTVKHD